MFYPDYQMINFFKYFFSFLIVMLSYLNQYQPHKYYFFVWIAISFFTTTYSYLWDIFMDWGFIYK